MASWVESVARDIRLGLRALRRNPLVTAAAVASVGLAFGACVAAFSLVDALILRPLPVHEPDRLVYLAYPTYRPERPESETFSDPLFVRLRDAARPMADLFAMSTQVRWPATLTGTADRQDVRTQYVSGDAFERLGVRPARGRLISPDDDTRAATPVVSISYAFWTRRFGGSDSTIGRTVTIADKPFQIVGVTEAGFGGVEPGHPTDVWLPYSAYNPRAFGNPRFHWFRVFGRLKGEASAESAQPVLQSAFTAFRTERARDGGPTADDQSRFARAPLFVRSAATGPSPLRREFERPLWIVAVIAGLMLLVAGSNVANLSMARAAAREHEMALRRSIGAGRAQLIQQVLIESALISAAAGIVGALFAFGAAPFVVSMLTTPDDPVQLDLRADLSVVALVALLTLLTTALFGLVPALRASRVDPMAVLKSSGRPVTGTTGMRPIVALQVAFAFVVLFVGSLLILSFARISSIDPGFKATDVVLVNVEPAGPMDAAEHRTALLDLLGQLRSDGGTKTASIAEFNTLGRAWTYNLRPPGSPDGWFEATIAPVSDGFFETMKIPLRSGRTFEPRDMAPAAAPAILVNENFARRYFGQAPAVGRTFEGRFSDNSDTPTQYEIVGVVADTKYELRQAAAPVIYLPFRRTGTIHLRTSTTPGSLDRIRSRIRTDGRFRVTTVTTQSEVIDQTLLRERLLAALSSFFAVVGLVLVGVGLYSVLSFFVLQRTREIGIRMALGARPAGVARSMVASVATPVVAGASAGLAGGLYLARFVESLLFEVTKSDAISIAVPLVALGMSGLFALLLPALRAARIDPVMALKTD
jgi:predicted permease